MIHKEYGVTSQETKSNRFMELEGVRGMAAIVVVIHHFLLAFFPFLIFGIGIQHNRFEDNIHGTPLAIGYAGTFAVAIFFVLSGFVLSIGFLQTKNENIIKKLAAKRYLRLMLPALASTLLCFFLLSLGGAKLIEHASSITLSTWLSGSWGFDTSIFKAIYSGAIGIFINTGSPFNNVLWTMKTEFFGSFMVFGFLLIFAKSKYRWIAYVALSIFTFNSWYLAFIIGMILADVYVLGWMKKVARKPILPGALLIGGLILGAYPNSGIAGTMYEAIQIGDANINSQTLYLTIGATMVILAVLSSNRLKKWLKAPKISILGRYTFSLYLTHLIVLYTFTTTVFVYLHQSLGYGKAVMVAVILSVPVVWLVTYMFERYVDAPSIRFSKYILEVYEGRSRLPDPKRPFIIFVEDYQAAKKLWKERVIAARTFDAEKEFVE